jgi:hypothetical protein
MQKSTRIFGHSRSVAVIIAPCSAKKTVEPDDQLRANSLTVSPQGVVARWWNHRLTNVDHKMRAADLYAGTSFKRLSKIAEQTDAYLYVASAGLGLVASGRHVPSYDLSVSRDGEASVAARVSGTFDHARWWNSVSEGPFSTSLAQIGNHFSDGRILIALTSPYAHLLGEAIDALPARIRRRVRLFGLGITSVLPAGVHELVLPYDTRLDGITPGIKADFAHRALEHFAAASTRFRRASGDLGADHNWVNEQLAGHRPTVAPQRERVDDDELVKLVRKLFKETQSATAALRILRQDWGRACEYSRFMDAFRSETERAAT